MSEENKQIAEALRRNNYPACVICREEIQSRQVSNNSTQSRNITVLRVTEALLNVQLAF